MQQNRIPYWSNYTVNINWHVVWRNIGSTDPRLQKQFLEELLNGDESDSTFLCTMENVTSDTEGWTRLILSREGRADLFRARVILKYMEQIDSALLLEMFDSILKVFDGTTWDNEMVKKFVSKIPKNIKAEKIDTTFDYAVRDDNLFAKKWEGLSYSEQIGALRHILQECIFEQELIDFREERETNLVRKMYPDYKYVSAANEKLMRKAVISYDPKVIKRIMGTLRGDDIEKYLMKIIEMKEAAPYTIYYIWNSLDKRVQAKYYDQVMAMLEGEPKTQYQLWIATRTNSQNQRKKLVSIIERIEEIGDMEKLKSEMRFLVKRVSKDKKGGRNKVPKATDEIEEEH